MGRTTFNSLSQDEKAIIELAFQDDSKTKTEIQKNLSERYGVTERAIRAWSSMLGIGRIYNPTSVIDEAKVLVYDIETSRVTAKVWWTGKQYVNHTQLIDEPAIISISWKWLGDDSVKALTWDKNHCDKSMLEAFLLEYNEADMVIGQNNDKFDNRWLNARAMKHDLFINTQIRSFDIMKQTKRLFRIPSYSMAYVSRFLGITEKQSHEGIIMWDKIEHGTDEEQKEYLEKMIEYNIGDIVTTEEMYYKLRKYMGHKLHFGVFNGNEKYSSPISGSTNVELFKTTYTAMGTIQHIMKDKDNDSLYKISNRDYMKFLEDKLNGLIR